AINEKILSWASIMEPKAEEQVKNIGQLPFVYKHVAVMPDAHLGKGACVGSVVATDGAIIPSWRRGKCAGWKAHRPRQGVDEAVLHLSSGSGSGLSRSGNSGV